MKPGDSVRAGDLTQRVTLQAPTYNAAGDEVTGWTNLVENVPAAKRSLRGRELADSSREVSEGYVIFTIRYRTGVDTVKRLVNGADAFDVDYIDNVNGSNRRLDITCRLVK